MRRVVWLVMDSFGVGSAPDAQRFGDQGANTLGHIAKACAEGRCNDMRRDPEGRQGPLNLPNLQRLGLGKLAELSMKDNPFESSQLIPDGELIGMFGCASELSRGKDTPSGHWEMAGVPVEFDWGYFPPKDSFAPELSDEILSRFEPNAEKLGYFGNCHASGTEILSVYGEMHMQTGKPIMYTSADSVFQIACHEQSFGLERLYQLCEVARKVLDEYGKTHGQIGRVIARPFVGTDATSFQRTGNRHDYSILPPAATVLNRMAEAGGEVVSIGKIADIFANSGITSKHKATGLAELSQVTLDSLTRYCQRPSIIFTNFVDFDSSYGHRRDVQGYAWALEYLDAWLPQLLDTLGPEDLLIMTADHGCDPSWQGTDHTREYIPIMAYHKAMPSRNIGVRTTFADMGQTVCDYLGLPPCEYGESFLSP